MFNWDWRVILHEIDEGKKKAQRMRQQTNQLQHEQLATYGIININQFSVYFMIMRIVDVNDVLDSQLIFRLDSKGTQLSRWGICVIIAASCTFDKLNAASGK